MKKEPNYPQHAIIEHYGNMGPFELAGRLFDRLCSRRLIPEQYWEWGVRREIIADIIGVDLVALEREKSAMLAQMQHEYDDRHNPDYAERRAIKQLFAEVDETGANKYRVVFLTSTAIANACSFCIGPAYDIAKIGAALKHYGYTKQTRRFKDGIKKGFYVPRTNIEDWLKQWKNL